MEEEEGEEETSNGFSDWETLPFSSSLSLSSTTPRHRIDHFSVSLFPPVNHEGLPVHSTAPPPPPLQPNSCNSFPPSSDSPPPSRDAHLAKWFNSALQIWNSKVGSFYYSLSFEGLLSSLCCCGGLTGAATVVGLCVWMWWRRRRRRRVGGSVQQLKVLLKERDEKIIQLLDQVAQLNKLLLARYKVPVLRSCG